MDVPAPRVGGQQRGIALERLYDPDEMLAGPHMTARRWIVGLDHGDGSVRQYPGPPFRSPSAPWRFSRRAPRIGEHDVEVIVGWLASEEPPQRRGDAIASEREQ